MRSAVSATEQVVVVPLDARHEIFILKEIIIQAGARCCPNHLQQKIEELQPVAYNTIV
jgi:hypothetical protein